MDDAADKTGQAPPVTGATAGEGDLDTRLNAAEAKLRRPVAVNRGETRGWAVGVEFVGTVLVSTFIGVMIDRHFGTTPWGMIVLLVLGFCAGVRRAMQTSAEFDADPGNDPGEAGER